MNALSHFREQVASAFGPEFALIHSARQVGHARRSPHAGEVAVPHPKVIEIKTIRIVPKELKEPWKLHRQALG
jgi:hypothetical protein